MNILSLNIIIFLKKIHPIIIFQRSFLANKIFIYEKTIFWKENGTKSYRNIFRTNLNNPNYVLCYILKKIGKWKKNKFLIEYISLNNDPNNKQIEPKEKSDLINPVKFFVCYIDEKTKSSWCWYIIEIKD